MKWHAVSLRYIVINWGYNLKINYNNKQFCNLDFKTYFFFLSKTKLKSYTSFFCILGQFNSFQGAQLNKKIMMNCKSNILSCIKIFYI